MSIVAGRSPQVLWRTHLTTTNNATFGTPTPYGHGDAAVVIVFVVDTVANTTHLCAIQAYSGAVLWKIPTPNMEAFSGWADVGGTANGTQLVFAGVSDGVLAVSLDSGDLVWRYTTNTSYGVSAHPTYFNGLVVFTFENGPDSSPLFAVNATTGAMMWTSDDQAFSKIWVLPHQKLIVYMSYNVSAFPLHTGVAVVARTWTGAIEWALRDLPTTGLNNNPNLDVDAEGTAVLMYSKPAETYRFISMLSATTGEVAWNLPTLGEVPDYDTYAYNGSFYRLVSFANGTGFHVERVGLKGDIVWSSVLISVDMNAILLVGGTGVFAFCPDDNVVFAFDVATGDSLWSLDVGGPTDGYVSEENVLYFGDMYGIFNAVVVN